MSKTGLKGEGRVSRRTWGKGLVPWPDPGSFTGVRCKK